MSESKIIIRTPECKGTDLSTLLEFYYKLGKNHVEYEKEAKKEARKIMGRIPDNVVIKYEFDRRLKIGAEIDDAIEKIMKEKGFKLECTGRDNWQDKNYLEFKKK